MKQPVTTCYRGNTGTVYFKPISSIRIKLARSGIIELSLPSRYSIVEGLSFLESKKDWIEHHLEKIRQTQALSLSDLSRIPFWGKSYPTKIRFDEKDESCWIDPTEDVFYLRLVSPFSAENALHLIDSWYQQKLEAYINPLLPSWTARMQVQVAAVQFRKMTSRWGTCHTSRHIITLNTELAKQGPDSIEYVLVHELAHLLEKGHSARFKAIMDDFLPDWRDRRKALIVY
jgi:predicted metal-dependent hydrolase